MSLSPEELAKKLVYELNENGWLHPGIHLAKVSPVESGIADTISAAVQAERDDNKTLREALGRACAWFMNNPANREDEKAVLDEITKALGTEAPQ